MMGEGRWVCKSLNRDQSIFKKPFFLLFTSTGKPITRQCSRFGIASLAIRDMNDYVRKYVVFLRKKQFEKQRLHDYIGETVGVELILN